MMKILVTGATGQLGYEVCHILQERGVKYQGVNSTHFDIVDVVAVDAYIREYQPDAVIHCAAYTAVDSAESNCERCFAVNEKGTRNIAQACRAVDAKMLYVSTDYIFSGVGTKPYEVDDKAEPQNVYGASKLAGELAVQETLTKYFIVRTSWLFGRGNNFIVNILQSARKKKMLSVVTDQIGSPTYAVDLAKLLCDMVESEQYGIYHATNEGSCSRYELAQEVVRQAWMDVQVRPCITKEYSLPAARPLNSRLSRESLDIAGFARLPDWRDALWRFLRCDHPPQKILVTGGNGYIGKHVVKLLLDAGYPVMVAVSHPEGTDPRAIICSEPIFSGADDIYRRVGSPDVCIHLAWKDGFSHNSPVHMENLSKHIVFCRHMMQGGLPILSCMGTMHEVGYWEGAIRENTPCAPQTQYGIAKNAMRQSLLLSARETTCVLHWLRLYYIVSDDVNGQNIFSKILKAAEKGQAFFPFTSGKNLYDFIEIDELARLIVMASLQTEISGVTNVCTGKPESLASCVERFIQSHHLSIKLEYGKYPDRPYDSPGEWGDSTKIRKIQENHERMAQRGTTLKQRMSEERNYSAGFRRIRQCWW